MGKGRGGPQALEADFTKEKEADRFAAFAASAISHYGRLAHPSAGTKNGALNPGIHGCQQQLRKASIRQNGSLEDGRGAKAVECQTPDLQCAEGKAVPQPGEMQNG